jgi:hypothetical protein
MNIINIGVKAVLKKCSTSLGPDPSVTGRIWARLEPCPGGLSVPEKCEFISSRTLRKRTEGY